MGYSFYGGRQGESFKIVRNFMSVDEMTEKFQSGAAYRDVNYGEYVLINSDDVRNPQNGQIYKRGVNGPEYIGNIAGNPGYSPHIIAADKFNEYTKSDTPYGDEIQNTVSLTKGSISIVDGGTLTEQSIMNFEELDSSIVVGSISLESGVDSVFPGTLFFDGEQKYSSKASLYRTDSRLPASLLRKVYRGKCSINEEEIVLLLDNTSSSQFFSMYFSKDFNSGNLSEISNIQIKEMYIGDTFKKEWQVDSFKDSIKVSTNSTIYNDGFLVVKNFIESNGEEKKEYKAGDAYPYSTLEKITENLEKGFIKPYNKTLVELGFQFPRTVFNFESNAISPYKRSFIKEDDETIDKLFAYGYTINVPKGIKGDSIIEICEENRPFEDNFSFDNISFSEEDMEKIKQLTPGSNFIYYKQENYDNGQEGLPSDFQEDTGNKVITTYHYIGPSPAGISIIPYNENPDSYEINLNGISFIARDDLKRLNFPDDWEDE